MPSTCVEKLKPERATLKAGSEQVKAERDTP